MTRAEARIQELYRAFNDRDFERFVALLTPDVDWPDQVEDSWLTGRDAVLAYMTETTAGLRAELAVIDVQPLEDGRLSVLAQQVITSAADGSVWSTLNVRQIYRMRGDLIARMDIESA